jgi:sugar phosphate isomerase/epimerase
VTTVPRRHFLVGAAGLAAQRQVVSAPAPAGPFTEFQIACMTLPYQRFPVERALSGIAKAGYRYVAFGPYHEQRDPIPPDAPPSAARDLARRARDLGLEPAMMFGVHYIEEPDAVAVYKHRIEQAAAAKIPYILAFGDPRDDPGHYSIWVRHLREIGPMARAAGLTVVIKQHGGNTDTGRECARILREVADDGIRMFYDAGNTWWYAGVDPIPDAASCAHYIHGFAIKDFRSFPQRTICGPGLGIIDHYQLLAPVARAPRKIVLACETIWAPYLPRTDVPPETIDSLARRAREYLETVTAGLRAAL